MSLCFFGRDHKIEPKPVTISISKTHPLILLAQSLPWNQLMDTVAPDLKKTAKGFWWLGRKLRVRLHLSVYLLQLLYNLTDRSMEEQLKYNALFQTFSGVDLLLGWHVPDHTKIEVFRNRLSPETQRSLANLAAEHAAKLGLADPGQVDIDSTVQEANASYPSDAHLMQKLAEKCKKIICWLKKKNLMPTSMDVDMSAIKRVAKGYFFLSKNTAREVRQRAFANLHQLVKSQTYPLIKWLEENASSIVSQTKWNIADAIKQVSQHGRRYLLDVAHFIRTGSMKEGKRLSFHLKDIACITKNKIGKKYEFGRVFQLGRIGGNFVFVGKCADLHMSDKKAITHMLEEHAQIFEEEVLSLATDKGYYSSNNTDFLIDADVEEFHLGYQYTDQTDEEFRRLYNRRAGIEPIIGHIKKGGQLGKSRMKTDASTLAAGYASICSFNLRQIMKAL